MIYEYIRCSGCGERVLVGTAVGEKGQCEACGNTYEVKPPDKEIEE